jgi:outer membrane protein assembly factor BamB
MSAELTLTPQETPAPAVAAAPAREPRYRTAVVLVALYWGVILAAAGFEKPYFVAFLTNLGTAALLTLAFFGWWWSNLRVALLDRAIGFVLVVGGAAAAVPLCHRSVGPWGMLMSVMPALLTAWTAWLVLSRKAGPGVRRLGTLAVVAATLGVFSLVRIDGLDGDLRASMSWRWTPTAEERFMEESAAAADAGSPSPAWSPAVSSSDWTAFRGAGRDGVVRGTTIADWKAAAPRQVWRRRVGPAWSSVTVVGDRLFTQEQRGPKEAVVCYEAATGKPLWVHEDEARFDESVSGAGPRATPTYAGGKLFTFGGTGLLNCLDAGTGKSLWSARTTEAAGAKPPMWGYSGSPLVAGGRVIVYAGGDVERGLLGYDVETGKLAWAAPAGKFSYSSPQPAAVAGQQVCLMVSDYGLFAVNPKTGGAAWQAGKVQEGNPQALQPHVVGKDQLLVGGLEGTGVTLLDVRSAGGKITPEVRWTSPAVKPEFPDFVVHEGHAYGFDQGAFCCLDLENGKRCWKKGRYGRGQVVLLADQALLLAVTEKGEAVLLSADPTKHEERGRFQAIEGKTWNHPVVVRGRLYVRNAEEMACYELPSR